MVGALSCMHYSSESQLEPTMKRQPYTHYGRGSELHALRWGVTTQSAMKRHWCPTVVGPVSCIPHADELQLKPNETTVAYIHIMASAVGYMPYAHNSTSFSVHTGVRE